MTDQMHRQAADVLAQAARSAEPCAPLTETFQGLDVSDAYAIQKRNIDRRLEEPGAGRIVGRKIGLTSEAIQSWLGVDEPDFGVLLDDMVIGDGGVADIARLLQPRAEAEIAFVLRRDLAGPGVTAADVIAATDYVLPCIEIIDSRIADWNIEYVDTVADNASSGLFVLGSTPRSLDGLDLRLAGMALRKNGRVVSTGAGAACLGHPLNAVAWLADKVAEFDGTLRGGEVILSGALGPAVDLAAGDALYAEIAGLGTVRFRCA